MCGAWFQGHGRSAHAGSVVQSAVPGQGRVSPTTGWYHSAAVAAKEIRRWRHLFGRDRKSVHRASTREDYAQGRVPGRAAAVLQWTRFVSRRYGWKSVTARLRPRSKLLPNPENVHPPDLPTSPLPQADT